MSLQSINTINQPLPAQAAVVRLNAAYKSQQYCSKFHEDLSTFKHLRFGMLYAHHAVRSGAFSIARQFSFSSRDGKTDLLCQFQSRAENSVFFIRNPDP